MSDRVDYRSAAMAVADRLTYNTRTGQSSLIEWNKKMCLFMEAVFGADASPIFRERMLPRCMRSDEYIPSPGLPEGDDPVSIKARESDYTEWRQERRDFILKKPRMVSVYLTGTLGQSSLDRVKDTREDDMEQAIKDSDILSVHKIVWDSHQYRGRTFKVADQQRVQREFTMFNFMSGESLPSLKRRLSELLEKMKNYDVSPNEFDIMYTFLMAAARYPNSHVQDICVDYLKLVDDSDSFPTNLNEVYELMVSTQDVVNQVASRGSQRQNHEGSVHQTAVRSIVRGFQNRRKKGDKKVPFQPRQRPVAQVNSAYSNINKSVRKKLETHTLSGRPKNFHTEAKVNELAALHPGVPRGSHYKVIRCSICNRIGHLDKDHRDGQNSTSRPQSNSKGPKKSFRGKKARKGKVNNTNGRTVTFDEDGDSGWIGSVFSIVGTQDRCEHYSYAGYDYRQEETCHSDVLCCEPRHVYLNRSYNINCCNNNYEEDMPTVFSSDVELQEFLDYRLIDIKSESKAMYERRNEVYDSDSESYSYESSYECSDEYSDSESDVDVPIISSCTINDNSNSAAVGSNRQSNAGSTPPNRWSSSNGLRTGASGGNYGGNGDDSEDGSDEGRPRKKRSLPDEPEDANVNNNNLPLANQNNENPNNYLLGRNLLMLPEEEERSIWVDDVLYRTGRIFDSPFKSYSDPELTLSLCLLSSSYDPSEHASRFFNLNRQRPVRNNKYGGHYLVTSCPNRITNQPSHYDIERNPHEFISRMYLEGLSRVEVIDGMAKEHSGGMYSETRVTMAHIEELDERWRLFDQVIHKRIMEIQGFTSCIIPGMVGNHLNHANMVITLRRILHRRNTVAIRDNRDARNWYQTLTGIASTVVANYPEITGVYPSTIMIVTFSAFVKLSGEHGDKKYSFARVSARVHIINGIGHIIKFLRVIRNLDDNLSPKYIEYDTAEFAEFDCVHDLSVSCPKTGRVYLETSSCSVVPNMLEIPKEVAKLVAMADFELHSVPLEIKMRYDVKNNKSTVDKLPIKDKIDKSNAEYVTQVILPGTAYYNIVIGKMYNNDPSADRKWSKNNVNTPLHRRGMKDFYWILQKVVFSSHEYLSSYPIPGYIEPGENYIPEELREELRHRFRGNDVQQSSIPGYERYICVKDIDGYYTWYVMRKVFGFLQILSEARLYKPEFDRELYDVCLKYQHDENKEFKSLTEKALRETKLRGRVYMSKEASNDESSSSEPEPQESKKQRIIDIGLKQLRYYPNEQHGVSVPRYYPAHIFVNGEWILDTEDSPRNVQVMADRWERYDRRVLQQIIPRVYVMPRDVDEWRQIIIARDIDISPAGRANWSRIQEEYADRFRGILEDPTRIDYMIACVYDGVTNICDFQEDHDKVILRATPPMIRITRDHVAENLERDLMYSDRLPYYFLAGRGASDREYEIMMENLRQYQEEHEIAFRNSGLPRFEYRLRYQQTIFENFGMPPADLVSAGYSYPRPGMINHPPIHLGRATDDPDVKKLEKIKLRAECDYSYRRDVYNHDHDTPPGGPAVQGFAVYLGVELRSDGDLETVMHQDADHRAKQVQRSKEWDKRRRREDRKLRVSKEHLIEPESVLIGISRTERRRYLEMHGAHCKLSREILYNLKLVDNHPDLDGCDSDNSSLSDEEIFRNRQERKERLEDEREQNRIIMEKQIELERLDAEYKAEVEQDCIANGVDLYGPVDLREWDDGADLSEDDPDPGGSVFMAKHHNVSTSRKFNNHTWLVLDTMANINVFRNPDLAENITTSSLPMNIDGVGEKGTRTQRRGVHPLFGEVWIVLENQYNIVSHYQAVKNGFLLRMSDDNKSCWLVNKDKNVSVYFEYDPEDHFFKTEIPADTVRSKAFNLTAIENNQSFRINNESMFYTQEQLRRAEIVEGLHVAMEHPSDQQLSAFLMSPSSINMPVTVQDLHNLRAIKGPCNSCQEGRPLPSKGSHTGANPGSEATQPGEELHCDIVFVQRNPRLFTVDHVTGYMTFTIMQSKHASDVLEAFESVINAYKSYLKVVRYISCDHEGVLKSLESQLNKLGVRLKIRLPYEHEKRAERAMRVVRERIRVKLRELPYKLPKKLFDSLAAECIRNINMMPNYRSMPHSPTELVRGDKINYLTDISPPFGSLVLCPTHGEQHKGSTEAKQEIAITLGPSNSNTRGGVLVYIPGRDNPVIRRNVRPMAMTSDIIDHMNKWAKELPGFENSEFVFKDTIATEAARSEDFNQDVDSSPLVVNSKIDNTAYEQLIDKTDSHGGVIDYVEEYSNYDPHNVVQSELTPTLVDISYKIDAKEVQVDNIERERQLESFSNRDATIPVNPPSSPTKEPNPSPAKTQKKFSREKHIDPAAVIGSGEKRTTRSSNPKVFQMSLRKAIQSEAGEAAIEAAMRELKQLVDLKTWVYIKNRSQASPSVHTKVTPCSMFLKQKFNSRGEFLLWKARLVDGGHRTDPTKYNPFEKSSPTSSLEAVYILLSMKVAENMELESFDVPSAYLNASLQPGRFHMMSIDKHIAKLLVRVDPRAREFVQPDGSILVEIRRSLYGLPEASKLWYDYFTKALTLGGYTVCPHDPCLFMRKRGSEISIIALYVDDCLHIWKGQNIYRELYASLRNAKLPDLKVDKLEGDKSVSFLGLNITMMKDRTLTVNQKGYLKNLLEEHGGYKTYPVTPCTDQLFKITDVVEVEETDNVESTPFASKLMKTRYCERTRPDICLPLAVLQTKMRNPNEQDDQLLDRVIAYLEGTEDRSMKIRKCDMKLFAYMDAAFAVHGNRVSHSGIHFTLGKYGNTILCKSIKQKTVATSSTEAELVCIFDGMDYLIWMRNVLEFLGYKQGTTTIFQDNTSTITMAYMGRGGSGSRTRHIDIKYFYIKQFLDSKALEIDHLGRDNMTADFFASPRQGATFRRFRGMIMGDIE